MTEGQFLFTLDSKQFNEILSQQNWFNLQHEFETTGNSLSQSFLIWKGETGSTWLLVDFETKRTYDIERETEAEEPATVEISRASNQEEQLIEMTNPKLILSRLQQRPQGTDEGFIDFLKRMDLGKGNLEILKRSDLSGAGFSFESAYRNLSTVHKMFREILTSSNESLIDLSRDDFQSLADYLRQFYEQADQINSFEIKGENPSKNYNSLLQTIFQFCEDTKRSLRQQIAYLNSKKVGQLEVQVRTTLTDAEEKLNTETEKVQKIGEEAQQKEEKRQESFDQLYIRHYIDLILRYRISPRSEV